MQPQNNACQSLPNNLKQKSYIFFIRLLTLFIKNKENTNMRQGYKCIYRHEKMLKC